VLDSVEQGLVGMGQTPAHLCFSRIIRVYSTLFPNILLVFQDSAVIQGQRFKKVVTPTALDTCHVCFNKLLLDLLLSQLFEHPKGLIK